MNHTDNERAAVLDSQTLAFLEAFEAQGGPPFYTMARPMPAGCFWPYR
jgi:hypothetical protein